MTEINQLDQTISRRNVIRFLAGVPALPLATGSVATLLTGCGSDRDTNSTAGILNNTQKPLKRLSLSVWLHQIYQIPPIWQRCMSIQS